ncbi:MAG: IMPACT family protein [Oscillospiraceae bacterium]
MAERRKPSGYGTGTYEEKRSRFIGELWPVPDEEEAKALIAAVRKKYPDARHHCWAWILPDGAFRWSDDGEPGGTAGAPMLEVLRGAELYGVLCVVTRYFGGTLLGSGGLVRAYSKATALALADAGSEPDPEKARLAITVRWESIDRVHRLLREYGGALLASDYESDPNAAILSAELLEASAAEFMARVVDVTGGRATAKRAEE